MHRAYRWNCKVGTLAVIGNHLPRRCGIATFTSDLSTALASELDGSDCLVLAMNEPGGTHQYTDRVAFEIAEAEPASYRRAADFLNTNGIDVVSLQHEYGIFGGKAGGLVLDLLSELRMPVVTTLHTILDAPSVAQRAVMDNVLRLSERVVVMSENGAELLRSVHRFDDKKIDVIPHGVPILPLAKDCKDKLGLEGNEVLLTFGLLSADKGLEYVIDALPRIVAAFPNTRYVVVGVTHPHVKEREGEAYRVSLQARAKRLGVDENIIFHDRFVSHDELVEFLAATDVYVTPYLKAEQITSGTLAYAVGGGKAVVSTPYRYAVELLAEGRGALVPWRDSEAIAREVIDLFGNVRRREAMEQRAAQHGRKMTWPIVAKSYVSSLERARTSHGQRARATFKAKTLAARPAELPEVDLTHLRAMTDDTGVLQHATFNIPRYADGYCLDDNARALLLMAMLEEVGPGSARAVRGLTSRYFAFVNHAYDASRGRFRNFMSFDRRWTEEQGSEDSHGRALWSLGAAVGRTDDLSIRGLASQLFHAALPAATSFTSPRAWAYTILGIDEYLRAFEGESSVRATMATLTEKLGGLFRAQATPAWFWCEDRLTYCNARLAQAMLVAGERLGSADAVATGRRALEWLYDVQSVDGYFAPIGSNGFYVRGETRAAFDQQPVEASASLSACLTAHRVTGDAAWVARARRIFLWYLGQNQLQLPLYDASSGGCRDGLHSDRVNQNQGAESTLSLLLSIVELRSVERVADVPHPFLRVVSPAVAVARAQELAPA